MQSTKGKTVMVLLRNSRLIVQNTERLWNCECIFPQIIIKCLVALLCSSLFRRDQTHVTIISGSLYCTWTQTHNQTRTQWHFTPSIYLYRFFYIIFSVRASSSSLDFRGDWIHYAILSFFAGKCRFSWGSQPPSISEINIWCSWN